MINQKQIAAAREAVADLNDLASACAKGSGYESSKLLEGFIDAVEAAMKAEPVAWTDENYMTIYVSEDIAKEENAVIPLYASPITAKEE